MGFLDPEAIAMTPAAHIAHFTSGTFNNLGSQSSSCLITPNPLSDVTLLCLLFPACEWLDMHCLCDAKHIVLWSLRCIQ